MHVITGLPRSGSTLLCNILNQNPDFKASSTSIVPALSASAIQIWSSSPEMKGFIRDDREGWDRRLRNVIKSISDAWHEPEDGQIVFDKSRGWTYHLLDLWSVWPDAKVLVTVRDLRGIFASVEKQHRKTAIFNEAVTGNKKTIFSRADMLFSPDSLVGSPLIGLKDIFQRKLEGKVHFVKLEDLAASPGHTMGEVYKYLGLPYYDGHDYKNVENTAKDPDWMLLWKFPHEGSGEVKAIKDNCWEDYMNEEISTVINEKFAWYQSYFGYANFPQPA